MDGYLRIWEVASNYCFRCYRLTPGKSGMSEAGGMLKPKANKSGSTDVDAMVMDSTELSTVIFDEDEEIQPSAHVAWNPNPELCLVAAAL